MSSGTVAPWSSSAQESTAPRSPYGSATRGSRPPSEATSTPTCPSKNARSPERRHDKPHPDATGRPTGYSPFSTACKSKAIMQPLSRQNLHSARDPPRAGHNRLPYISRGYEGSAISPEDLRRLPQLRGCRGVLRHLELRLDRPQARPEPARGTGASVPGPAVGHPRLGSRVAQPPSAPPVFGPHPLPTDQAARGVQRRRRDGFQAGSPLGEVDAAGPGLAEAQDRGQLPGEGQEVEAHRPPGRSPDRGGAEDHLRQEGTALANRSSGLVRPWPDVGVDAVPVGLVRCPVDEARVMTRDEHTPLRLGKRSGSLANPALIVHVALLLGPAVGVGPSVRRIGEHIVDCGVGGPDPADPGQPVGLQGEREPLGAEPQPDLAYRAELIETGEDAADRPRDRLVGVQEDLAVLLTVDEADRQTPAQLALGGLVADPALQPGPQHVQLGFRHGPLETEHEAVVEPPGVVDAVAVSDQGVGDPTEIEQPVPVRGVAGQP